jgi:hypothetical protein
VSKARVTVLDHASGNSPLSALISEAFRRQTMLEKQQWVIGHADLRSVQAVLLKNIDAGAVKSDACWPK